MEIDDIKKDLENICNDTYAQSLFYDDIHTLDYHADALKYLKAVKDAGYSLKDSLKQGIVFPEYGGGLTINHQGEKNSSGYILYANHGKNLIVLSGMETDYEQHTLYHECGHLYQNKLGLFNVSDDAYSTYLSEVHANTFASMVFLLKSKTVLDYKKEKLRAVAAGIATLNRTTEAEENLYYVSLPIELQLMKDIRRKGRKKVLKTLMQNGSFDFEQVARYTASLVEKYAYTQEQWNKMVRHQKVHKYDRLRRKAKIWKILGDKYIQADAKKSFQKQKRHAFIDAKRRQMCDAKLQNLPQVDQETRRINAACAIDVWQTKLAQAYGYYENLSSIVQNKTVHLSSKFDFQAQHDILQTRDIITDLYNLHKNDEAFMNLFNMAADIQKRDQLWALKEKKEKQLNSKTNIKLQKTHD